MTPYFILVLLIFILFILLCRNTNTKNKDTFFFISLLILFVFSSLRSKDMGADYAGYVGDFNNIRNGFSSYYETGYVLFNKFIGNIIERYYGLAIGVNLLLFVPFYIYLKKYVKKEYLPWCVFIFLLNPYLFIQSTFNALRQSCATGILLIALCFLERVKIKSIFKIIVYFIFVMIAAQFHSVAYIFLLLPLLLLPHYSKRMMYIIVIVCLTFNIIGFSNLLNLFSSIFGFQQYLTYKASLLNRPIFVIFVFAVILFFIDHYNELTEYADEKRFVDFYILSLCFLLIAVTNDMIFRVYIMWEFISMPGLTIILSKRFDKDGLIHLKNGNKTVKLIYSAFYLCFFCGYIIYLGITNNVYYIPFSFCF